MTGTIIWYITVFGCAMLFCGIGIYAQKIKKPIWFWSGTEVDRTSVSDIPTYNRENAKMWFGYSLWYWAAGLLWHWSTMAAVGILVLGGTLGIVLLIRNYLKIEKKYKRTGL